MEGRDDGKVRTMAFAWIKIEDTTPDKPEVWAMAAKLGIDADAVVGKLVRIWIWADHQTIDGNAQSVTKALLDRCAGVAGFADAMMEAGWLVATPAGVSFVNFDRHNGETAKKRAQTSRRVQRHRAQSGACNADSVTSGVTKALPEKRREERKERENGEQGQPYIPEKMNTPECLKAFEDWCDYLDAAGLDSINPRYNGPQAEAVWKQAHRFGPEKWPLCVQFSIANAYKSIVEPAEPIAKTRAKATKPKPDQDPDFLKTLEAYRRWPDASDEHRQARAGHLGDTLLRIAKRIGGDRFVSVTEYTLPRLAAEFSRVKDEVNNEPF